MTFVLLKTTRKDDHPEMLFSCSFMVKGHFLTHGYRLGVVVFVATSLSQFANLRLAPLLNRMYVFCCALLLLLVVFSWICC